MALPPNWTNDYMPSQTEWQGAFADAISEAKVYADQLNATVTSTTNGLSGTLAGTTQNVTALGASVASLTQSVSTLTTSATHNPATLDQNMNAFAIKNMAQGTLPTDAARMDQVGWQRIGPDTIVNGANVGLVGFSLPTGYAKFRLEWYLFSASSAAGAFFLRCSTNGLSSSDFASNYNYGFTARVINGAQSYVTGNTTYCPLTNAQTGNQMNTGHAEFNNTQARGEIFNTTDTLSYTSQISGLFTYAVSNVNAVYVGMAADVFSSGFVRLLGWKTP